MTTTMAPNETLDRRFTARIGSIVIARHGQPQTFTLLRFSQAARPGRSTQPDLFEELVTSDFTARAATALEPLKVSETAVGPETALEAIDQLVGDGQSETRVVYLVSDLRRPQWGAPEGLAKHLERLSTAGAPRAANSAVTCHPSKTLRKP